MLFRSGFINDHSKIRVRILSTNANDRFDRAFWERRLRYAVQYRQTVMGEQDFHCCRLIFGEADSFPGLTVDRFEDILVIQTLSLGIEQRKDLPFPLLVEILRESGATISAIYERNDVALREKAVSYTHLDGQYLCHNKESPVFLQLASRSGGRRSHIHG